MTYTHKVSGWTRIPMADGSGCWRIVPTDGSGERIVRPLAAGEWANDASDDRANMETDRVVLLEGAPLPAWAVEWLTGAAVRQFARNRRAFSDAIAQADMDADMRDAWSY